MPFIEEILNNIRAIICDLQPQQVHTFYEAVGYMIQAQVVCTYVCVYMYSRADDLYRFFQDSVVQERLIEKYMSLPNEIWDTIIQRASVVCDGGGEGWEGGEGRGGRLHCIRCVCVCYRILVSYKITRPSSNWDTSSRQTCEHVQLLEIPS